MIAYALEATSKSQLFDKIHVSTDSDEIKSVVNGLCFDIDFMLPKQLSNDLT